MSDKRKDYINWDEYFMGVAKLSGLTIQRPEYSGWVLYCQSG